MADILTMGMDVGSTTSKCLILRGGKDILATALIQPAGIVWLIEEQGIDAILRHFGYFFFGHGKSGAVGNGVDDGLMSPENVA